MEFPRYPQLIPYLFNGSVVRSSMKFYFHFNLSMDRSHGFGSTSCYSRPLQTRFRSGSGALHLNLATHSNSPARSTKSTWSLALPLLVNIGFQVLFHSPPGVLFTFPSRYYALSVAIQCLGLEGGPPGFPQDSSCLVVLWILLISLVFNLHGFYTVLPTFPGSSDRPLRLNAVLNPEEP